MMPTFLSVVLTLVLQQPVMVPGCCPVGNFVTWRVVPMLVAVRPVSVPMPVLSALPVPSVES